MPLTKPLPPLRPYTLPLLRLPQHRPPMARSRSLPQRHRRIHTPNRIHRALPDSGATRKRAFTRVRGVDGLAEGEFPRLFERIEPFLRAVFAPRRIRGGGARVFEGEVFVFLRVVLVDLLTAPYSSR